MPKTHEHDGVEVELDDDIDPEDLDQGAESRDDDAVDWEQVEADGENDSQMTEAVGE